MKKIITFIFFLVVSIHAMCQLKQTKKSQKSKSTINTPQLIKFNFIVEKNEGDEYLYFKVNSKKIELDMPYAGFERIKIPNTLMACESTPGQGLQNTFFVVKENDIYILRTYDEARVSNKDGAFLDWKKSKNRIVLKFDKAGNLTFIDSNYHVE